VWREQERPSTRGLEDHQPGWIAGVIARFEQERQALAMMDHPNIAKVSTRVQRNGAGPSRHGAVEGSRSRLLRRGKSSDCRALRIVSVLPRGAARASKGIIHRDLKPSNILVTTEEGAAVPKVIDFGVAKATQQGSLTDFTVFTRLEQMIGTRYI
jgi:serine/threonine protein kinase